MKVTFVCVLAVVLALFAGARAADDGEEFVLVLDESNFDDEIAKQSLTLVEFYAPWCGHCKALAPEYAEAAKKLEGANAGALAKVDCTEHRDLCGKYDVKGFPTLKLFRNDGADPVDYDQARKADAIVRFMKKQGQPAVTELADEDAVKNFAEGESVSVVAFVDEGADLEAYTSVAKALRNEYSFGVVAGNADANKAFGVEKTPAVVVRRDFDEGDVQFDGDFGGDDMAAELTSFVKAQSFPLVGEIGPENYMKYVDRGFNFVWVFIDPESSEHEDLIKGAVSSVAADYRDKLSFVKLDGVKWSEHAKSFGLSGGTPGVVIEDREARKNFVLPEEGGVTEDALRAHVSGYLDGSLKPTLKSEPVPEDNSGPVFTLVGTEFEKIVYDETKDVLVEFYAPWCGHCKSLAPKYEKLGERFADNDNVVIAKLDATANDSPEDISGFPTLIFYPAGADKQANKLDYNGARDADGMAEFILENGKSEGLGAAGAADDEEEEGDEDDAPEHAEL